VFFLELPALFPHLYIRIRHTLKTQQLFITTKFYCMKNQGIAAKSAGNKNTTLQPKTSSQLSDEAFYLIALASLLKKEFGVTSLNQFLAQESPINYKGRTAA
jgi:hypothetical protein